MLLLQFAAVATVLAFRPPAQAQTPGTAATPRALAGLVAKLRANATLPDSLRGLTATDLIGRGRDVCWSTRLLMDGMAALPPAELGPFVRKMFGGGPGSK